MITRGEGSTTQRDLIVVTYSNSVGQKGRVYMDTQLNAEALDLEQNPQTDLHGVSVKKTIDGKTSYANSVGYSASQFEKIKEAAGDNVYTETLQNGQTRTILGITADLMKISKGQLAGKGLMINTKSPMSKSEFKVDENTLSKQNAYTNASKQIIEARKEKQTQMDVENQVENEATIAEPTFEEDSPSL